jgi:hypothetical protein
MTDLGGDDGNLIVEFTIFVNCYASLAVAQSMFVKLCFGSEILSDPVHDKGSYL